MTDSKIDQLKKLVGKNPDNPLGRYGLANEYYKEGQFENTIRELEIYFKIKDDEGAAYRPLGGEVQDGPALYPAVQAIAGQDQHPLRADVLSRFERDPLPGRGDSQNLLPGRGRLDRPGRRARRERLFRDLRPLSDLGFG